MDGLISDQHEIAGMDYLPRAIVDIPAAAGAAARRLEEVRAFLERFAAGEPPPEGCTYEEWAKELLA